MNNIIIATAVLVVIVLIWVIVAYNRLVTMVNRVKESWADIDVQLKRRYDLIPNLVNTVKGYAAHESSAFQDVTSARTAAMSAGTLAEKGQAEATLAGSLKSVLAIAEAYPELKANQNFLALQTEITDTEDKIEASRRFYNASVRDLNTTIQAFPRNIIASAFHFSKMDFFQLDASDANTQNPVNVSF